MRDIILLTILIIIFFASIFLVLYIMVQLTLWFVHIQECKNNSKKYGWGNYKKFKREFNKYTWKNREESPFLCIESNLNTYIREGIVKFDGKGMVIWNPVAYFLSMTYAKRSCSKKLKKADKIKIKW